MNADKVRPAPSASMKPRSSNAGVIFVIVLILAVCIPALLVASLAVAGGVLTFWAMPVQSTSVDTRGGMIESSIAAESAAPAELESSQP